MVDYLVIGLGLAGIAFCDTLEQNGKSFTVIDDDGNNASRVAGGLYNPVVLKRISKAWRAEEQLPMATEFYIRLEQKLGVTFHQGVSVMRRFSSVADQNQWSEACEKPEIRPFLYTGIRQNSNPALNIPFGLGEVVGAGRVDTTILLSAYASYLRGRGKLVNEKFDHSHLELSDTSVHYGKIKARRIVFATGFGMTSNPFFDYLPLQPNKGEYLEILCTELKEKRVIKGGVFLIPLGNDRYSVGATYDRNDHSLQPTSGARAYIESKLRDFLASPYTVLGQVAGIRPTVPDRRPLVGQHPEHHALYVINGFGSRGVMIAPYAAAALFKAIEKKEKLDPEMDIARYGSIYRTMRRPRPGDRNG